MKEINPKKYKNFIDFNLDACHLTEYVKNNTAKMTLSQQIIYMRNNFTKELLNGYIIVGTLSDNIKNELNTKNNKLFFSMDNMIKNRLSHPEVEDSDYEKIVQIIKSPSKYYKSQNGYDIILFKVDKKYYKLVIKTTKNRKENFVKSLHLLNKERYEKY